MPEPDFAGTDPTLCDECEHRASCYAHTRCLRMARKVEPPATPKPCCGAVGAGVHLPGCPKRVAELARSGAFDD
jgi:hypothetical protein